MARNEDLWLELYTLPVFSEENPDNGAMAAQQAKAWEWAQKLENDGKLTQLQLIQLKPLLEAVHEYGRLTGIDDVT